MVATVRNILTTSACVVAMLGAGLIWASPAMATPTGCYAQLGSVGGYARCDGGTGEVRVIVGCSEDGPGVLRYGDWVGPNLNSIIFCHSVAVSYQTRG